MRLYRRSKQIDLNDTIALCDFDADHGRVKLALERLHDLEEEVGADAKISYAEGLLQRDFLGQGQHAYLSFVRAQELNPQHALAACNAAQCAPSEATFRQWASVASRLSPPDAPALQQEIQQLAEGASYQELLLLRGTAESASEKHGSCASLFGLALLADAFEEETEESQIRRHRAQSLREVDREAERLREASGEWFPPEERLSLQEAVLELDRAITLDEHDAELWNLRSAWCVILERNNEAVTSADRAISLRPSGYPKPYHNKAVALWFLRRDQEALAIVTRAKDEARAVGAAEILRLAESFLANIQGGRADWSEELVLHTAQKLLKGTGARTHQYAGSIQGTVSDLYRMFAARLNAVQQGNSLEHVAPVAQLLAYFPAEAAATVLRNLRGSDPSAWNCCLEAVCYIVAKGEPLMQRDAARVAALLMLDEPTLERMRHACRERVLVPAAAAAGEFGHLAKCVRRELWRLNNRFPELLLEQSQPTQQELLTARSGMLIPLSGTPFINDSANFQQPTGSGSGCAGLLTLIVVTAALLSGLVLWVK